MQPLNSAERQNQADGTSFSRVSQAIGHTRFVVLLAVAAVLLVALSLFLLGTVQAVVSVWNTWSAVIVGWQLDASELAVEFLEIVIIMLHAVVFYVVGVGLYGLFVAPLNLTVSLGVETFNDLEIKLVSVVVVILAVTFLEHFIRWGEPLQTLQFGAAMAVVVAALVFFAKRSHEEKAKRERRDSGERARARQQMFDEEQEESAIARGQEGGGGPSR